jgi:hypothetical protein
VAVGAGVVDVGLVGEGVVGDELVRLNTMSLVTVRTKNLGSIDAKT